MEPYYKILKISVYGVFLAVFFLILSAESSIAGMIDKTKAPNAANEGISKSLEDQIGAGRGDTMTPDSSIYIINRDPFRAIRRGRQIFQRKFSRNEGQGPGVGDGHGNIHETIDIGAGLSDSCAGCHGRPKGSAGFGGDVVTRPDSRDAMHLFGLGLKEMLADEITADLRTIRDKAREKAVSSGEPATLQLNSKGIHYGSVTAHPNGYVDTSGVEGVDEDLRVRPFAAHGGTISIREFIIVAFHGEMGMHHYDPDTEAASKGGSSITPSGMHLDGARDRIQPSSAASEVMDVTESDQVANEVDLSIVDYLEFYLLNYFKPARYKQTEETARGRLIFKQIMCTSCHIPNLPINHDRRVADVETFYDPDKGGFNSLYAVATPLYEVQDDNSGYPAMKVPRGRPFLVEDIFTDFKRHDLGPSFYELNYNGTLTKNFLTMALWGVGSTSPYGHDGRSINLMEVILRHGGEATASRNAFAGLSKRDQIAVIDFLNSLVLFPPDDTASNLDPGNPDTPGFPQLGHGKINLSVLFNDPSDPE